MRVKKLALLNVSLAFSPVVFLLPKRHWCFNTNASFF